MGVRGCSTLRPGLYIRSGCGTSGRPPPNRPSSSFKPSVCAVVPVLQCACVWAVLGRWCSVQSVRCASVDDRRNHQKIQISRAPAFPHNCALARTRLCPTRGRGYARSRRAATGLGWLAPIPKASRWARLGLQGRLGSSREALARVVSLPHLGRAGLSRRAWLRSRSLRCRWSALCNWPAGFGGLPLRRCSGGASHVRLALRGVRGGGQSSQQRYCADTRPSYTRSRDDWKKASETKREEAHTSTRFSSDRQSSLPGSISTTGHKLHPHGT